MKKYELVFSILIFGLFFSGCSTTYHELATNKKLIKLKHDGILVGIGKRINNNILSDKFTINNPTVNKTSKEFLRLTSQSKKMLVTHILKFENRQRIGKDFYNPFIMNDKLSFEEGYSRLEQLKQKIILDLKDGDYTHIVFMSMGWHNDEKESVRRYNKIISEIKKQNADFKPYLFVLTWPSSWWSGSFFMFDWIGHKISYPTKSNDADEIGFTIANYILHNTILGALSSIELSEKNIKSIAIGHSMGARILSRAIFSREYLTENNNQKKELDLFIGLQPAFSANRFINGAGIENSPYNKHKQLKTKFIITASEYDSANNIAKWSEHLGGKDSFDTVNSSACNYSVQKASYCNNIILGLDFNTLWESPKRIEYIKCSFVKDHNDILDDEMGFFLNKVIKNLE